MHLLFFAMTCALINHMIVKNRMLSYHLTSFCWQYVVIYDEIPIPAIDEIKLAGYERTDNDDLDEDKWIHPNYNDEDDRNIFDVLDDE